MRDRWSVENIDDGGTGTRSRTRDARVDRESSDDDDVRCDAMYVNVVVV
jgi:hypothetical protein